jgi:2-oxoglutarate ferredoxin oxidoreductase subunit beta
MSELVALLDGSYYVTRQAVNSAKTVRKAKKAIKTAFQYQLEGKGGTSFIEIISNCPAGWKMTPLESNQYINRDIVDFFPLGDYKLPAKGI